MLWLQYVCVKSAPTGPLQVRYSLLHYYPMSRSLLFTIVYFLAPPPHNRYLSWRCTRWSRRAYPESSENDPGDLLFDGLLQNVGQGGHHVVAAQLLTQLRAEGQKPHAEDHLVLQLEATLVTQHCRDARRNTAHVLVMYSHVRQVYLHTSTRSRGGGERMALSAKRSETLDDAVRIAV